MTNSTSIQKAPSNLIRLCLSILDSQYLIKVRFLYNVIYYCSLCQFSLVTGRGSSSYWSVGRWRLILDIWIWRWSCSVWTGSIVWMPFHSSRCGSWWGCWVGFGWSGWMKIKGGSEERRERWGRDGDEVERWRTSYSCSFLCVMMMNDAYRNCRDHWQQTCCWSMNSNRVRR